MKTPCCLREATHRRPQTVRVHGQEMSRRGQSPGSGRRLGARAEWAMGGGCQREQFPFGVWKMFWRQTEVTAAQCCEGSKCHRSFHSKVVNFTSAQSLGWFPLSKGPEAPAGVPSPVAGRDRHTHRWRSHAGAEQSCGPPAATILAQGLGNSR